MELMINVYKLIKTLTPNSSLLITERIFRWLRKIDMVSVL